MALLQSFTACAVACFQSNLPCIVIFVQQLEKQILLLLLVLLQLFLVFFVEINFILILVIINSETIFLRQLHSQIFDLVFFFCIKLEPFADETDIGSLLIDFSIFNFLEIFVMQLFEIIWYLLV